jgi:hypothetical protein
MGYSYGNSPEFQTVRTSFTQYTMTSSIPAAVSHNEAHATVRVDDERIENTVRFSDIEQLQ